MLLPWTLTPVLLHDYSTSSYYAMTNPVVKWWGIKDKLKLSKAKFHGYWYDKTFQSAVEKVCVSWYELPQGSPYKRLVIVGNLGRKDQVIKLKVNKKALGFSGKQIRYYDLWNNDREIPENKVPALTVKGGYFLRCKPRDPETPIDRKEGGYWPSLKRENFSPIIDVEDHNMVMMQLENGAQAAYLQCHYTPDSERNYTFIGTSGRLENIGDAGACVIHVWTNRGRRSEPDIVYHLKPIEGNHGGADGPIVQNFIDFVRNDAKCTTSPIAARNAVAVGVLGHESMRNGCIPKDIPPLPAEILEYFENNQQKTPLN